MEATLAEQPQSGSRSDRETKLFALVADLRNELAMLHDEVVSLRQQVGYWKSMHDRAVRRNEKLQQRVDELEAENRQLKDRLFGSKSEKGSRKDRSNQLEDPEQSSGKLKLISKGRYGISVWVHVLLSKFGSHRATGNLIDELEQYDLDLPPGTVTGGLKRLVPLLEPIYEALLERNAQSTYRQTDETRWPVFIEWEGKNGYRWWLWAFLGEDTVVFRIAPTRSHEIPEEHYPQDVRAFLMVDRYSAYKAMVQVKLGVVILVFCWAHVRRDFVEVGKGWPELADWALPWLRRIRDIYHLKTWVSYLDPSYNLPCRKPCHGIVWNCHRMTQVAAQGFEPRTRGL